MRRVTGRARRYFVEQRDSNQYDYSRQRAVATTLAFKRVFEEEQRRGENYVNVSSLSGVISHITGLYSSTSRG